MLYENPKNNLEEELAHYRMIGIYTDVTDGDDYDDYWNYWNEIKNEELERKGGDQNGIDALEGHGR